MTESKFNILETTIEDIHRAYASGELTCRQLVQAYLDRIAVYDKQGPALNTIITLNAQATEEAEQLDARYKTSGSTGSLHGIPVIVKDQADVKGMPTTLGSVLFKDYFPDRDSFVVERLRKASAVILGKSRSEKWPAVTRTARSSARREIPTTWSARSAVRRAARQRR